MPGTDNRLTGKRALVTAAAQGIGYASALALAAAGARVLATDIDEIRLASLADHGIETCRMDVRDTNSVTTAFEYAGATDILFNCAGCVHHGTLLESTDEQLDLAYDLNVKAMFRTIRAVLPGMLERSDGCIINMSSVVSSVKGVPLRCVYATTKAAVIGLTKSVAADYVGRGIRCNAICPGTVETPSLEERLRARGNYEQTRAAFVARQPIGRIGRPAGGDCRPRGVSGRSPLYHRSDPRDRWRLEQLNSTAREVRIRCHRIVRTGRASIGPASGAIPSRP